MAEPYTDAEAAEARQWSNRHGPPNSWTATAGTAARMIGRLLDERERLRAEIASLRIAISRLAGQDATLSVQGGNVIVEMDPPCPYVTGTVTRYCTLTPFTLTAAEREAIAWCRDNLTAMAHTASAFAYIHAATLRGLLERLK